MYQHNVNNFDLMMTMDYIHEAAITLFLNSFNNLKKDGIYIIGGCSHFQNFNKLKFR